MHLALPPRLSSGSGLYPPAELSGARRRLGSGVPRGRGAAEAGGGDEGADTGGAGSSGLGSRLLRGPGASLWEASSVRGSSPQVRSQALRSGPAGGRLGRLTVGRD